MNRVFLSFAIVAVLAVSVHARTIHPAQLQSVSWAVPQAQELQSAGVHSLVAASFHAIHAGY